MSNVRWPVAKFVVRRHWTDRW